MAMPSVPEPQMAEMALVVPIVTLRTLSKKICAERFASARSPRRSVPNSKDCRAARAQPNVAIINPAAATPAAGNAFQTHGGFRVDDGQPVGIADQKVMHGLGKDSSGSAPPRLALPEELVPM